MKLAIGRDAERDSSAVFFSLFSHFLCINVGSVVLRRENFHFPVWVGCVPMPRKKIERAKSSKTKFKGHVSVT